MGGGIKKNFFLKKGERGRKGLKKGFVCWLLFFIEKRRKEGGSFFLSVISFVMRLCMEG